MIENWTRRRLLRIKFFIRIKNIFDDRELDKAKTFSH